MPVFWWVAMAVCLISSSLSAEDLNTVYIIRGGGGYFPNLETTINEKFESEGLEVISYKFHERFKAAKEIERAYKAGELPSGVVLVGYSLGGCGSIKVSRILKEKDIPVRFLFLIETINPLQAVPSNVEECFNLYHFPAVLGHAVRTESKDTELINCEAYSDAGFGLEYSHFLLPFVDEVHNLIANEVSNSMSRKAPDQKARVARLN